MKSLCRLKSGTFYFNKSFKNFLFKKKAKRCTQTLDHNNVAKLQWQVRANCDVFTFDGKCGCKLESGRGHSFFVRFRINRLCSCEDLLLSTWLRLMYLSLTFENRLKLNPVTVFGFSFSLFIMYFFFFVELNLSFNSWDTAWRIHFISGKLLYSLGQFCEDGCNLQTVDLSASSLQ